MTFKPTAIPTTHKDMQELKHFLGGQIGTLSEGSFTQKDSLRLMDNLYVSPAPVDKKLQDFLRPQGIDLHEISGRNDAVVFSKRFKDIFHEG